jgi:hypothetical protein
MLSASTLFFMQICQFVLRCVLLLQELGNRLLLDVA